MSSPPPAGPTPLPPSLPAGVTLAPPALPAGLDTPVAVVDLDVTRRNVERMQRHADASGVRLRPHVKTHKSIELGRLQVAAGASGITAGTMGEVEVFADAGFDDIFFAYPVWAGGDRGRRLRAIHERIRLSVGLDSREAADALADAMAGSARPLRVVIEVDCGAHRCGVPAEAAGALAAYAAGRGLEPVGAFTYPGHGDREPAARQGAANDELATLEVALAAMRAAGFEPRVASGGSTPTSAYAARPPMTEIRPGEYALNDVGKLRLGACGPDDIALWVLTTVVSTAVPGQAILDVGTKVLGREGSAELGFGVVPGIPGSLLRRLNEYHGYLALDPAAPPPRVGDVVALAPIHVCPVVNLYDELVVHQGGRIIDHWRVDARGHLA